MTRWVSASTGLMAFVLFLPGIFVEHSCSGLVDPACTTVDALKKKNEEEEEEKEDLEGCNNEEKIKTNRDSTRSESKRPIAAAAAPGRPRRELLMQFSSISVVDGQLFQEYSSSSSNQVKGKESRGDGGGGGGGGKEWPNMLATIASTYNFFSFLFNFVLLET